MDSNYEEIEDEYESALEDKRQKDAIKVQGWWFMSLVNSIEYGNAYFDPFGLNLDGWGEQVSEDLDSYEEIFGELYQKYKGGKLAPELALLLRLGFSAAVVNFTNKALSSATPGFNDVIKQSPELMKMFTNATVQSMSQASPGFGMASELLQQQPKVGREPEPNMNFGPPPPAVATKNQPPPQRHPLANMQFSRPDIMAARGEGIDLQQNTPVNMDQPTMMRGPPQSAPRPEMRGPPTRPEMRGPQNMDLDNILSNLKVKAPEPPARSPPTTASSFFGGAQAQTTIEDALAPPPMQPQPAPTQTPIQFNIQEQLDTTEIESVNTSVYNENDSMISISSMREMQNVNVPKRAGRKKRQANQATISLDI